MQNGLKKLFEKIKEMNMLKYDLLNKTQKFFSVFCFIRGKKNFSTSNYENIYFFG